MLILVRKIRMKGDQIVDRRDVELHTSRLRVGSDEDQELQLLGLTVAPEHALLTPQYDGSLRINCKRKRHVNVDGRVRNRVLLAIGEWAQLGSHRLTAIQAPPGFDAGVEVRIDTTASQAVKARLHSGLRLKLPRLHGYSYLLLLLVSLLGLGLPLLSYYNANAARVIEHYGGASDQLWSTGPLAAAHHVPGIAENCNVCHVKPFQRVQNQACLQCHDKTTAHFPAAHPRSESFNDRCQSCHKEHNEPPTLIVKHKALCTDCHSRQQQRIIAGAPAVGTTPVVSAPDVLPPVIAFTATSHPEFLVSLLRLSKPGWGVQRVRLGSSEAQESSGLKFPHELHLNHEKVSLADGPGSDDRALLCTDCHQLEREGEHFKPISMEATCSGCHSLAFDDVQPDRQLPHGEPETLRTYLEEYYVSQAARQRRTKLPDMARRVPNATSAQPRRCQGDALTCGLKWADLEMQKLFTKAGCVSCHEVSRDDGEWQVRPVRLVEDWYSAARFDHRPHLNPGARTDGKTCLGCHAAATSPDSHDVLMPGLNTCLACHGEDHDPNIVLQCVDCHSFHRRGLPRMGDIGHE